MRPLLSREVLWTECLCWPQIFICWNRIPNVMVFGGGALKGKHVTSGEPSKMGGIHALLQRGQIAHVPSFCHGTIQQEADSLQPTRGLLPEPNLVGTFILYFQPLEQWEINVCCWKATQFIVFCYSSPKWLRQKVFKEANHFLWKTNVSVREAEFKIIEIIIQYTLLVCLGRKL